MKPLYLHRVELSTRQTIIVIDDIEITPTTYAYLNDAPIVDADGDRIANKNGWTLGPVESKQEANTLALCIAERYGWDVMIDGKMAGLPCKGKSGKWISNSEAAVSLGKLGGLKKSPRKSASSAENGRKGGRPKKIKPLD